MFLGNLRFEERVCGESLLFSDFCEVGICPDYGSVSFEFGPVVIPGFGSVEGFGYVVVAFTVAAHVEEFVGSAGRALGVEVLDVLSQTLPGWEFGG